MPWAPPSTDKVLDALTWHPPDTDHEVETTTTQNGPAPPEAEGALTSFFRPLVRGIVPAVATAAGGTAAGLAAIETGPGAIAADIAGGIASGAAAEALQNKLIGEQALKDMEAQETANRAAHPFASGLGAMIPGVISALGGNIGPEARALKQVGGSLGDLIGNPKTAKEAVKFVRGGITAPATIARSLEGAATSGARMAGSEEAQRQVEQGDLDIAKLAESPIRGALTFGPTAFVPGTKSILEGIYKKTLPDAAIMTVANHIYDYAVHDKPLDPAAIAAETGESIPGFVLLNVATGLLHGHPWLPEKTTKTGTTGTIPPVGGETDLKPTGTAVEPPEDVSAPVIPPEGSNVPTATPEGKNEASALLQGAAAQLEGNPDTSKVTDALKESLTASVEVGKESVEPSKSRVQELMDSGLSKEEAQRQAVNELPAQENEIAKEGSEVLPEREVEPREKFALPKELSKAKPRYSYGSKQYQLDFESDFDLAAYILAQKIPSKRDADYLRAVISHSGMTEEQARAYGVSVRDRIKPMARDGKGGETLYVPSSEVRKGSVAQRQAVNELPTKPEDALQIESPGGVLQHPQEGARETGSERPTLESGIQGDEFAREGAEVLPESEQEVIGALPEAPAIPKVEEAPAIYLKPTEPVKSITTEDQRAKLDQLKADYEIDKKNIEKSFARDPEQKGKQLKGLAMQYAAEKRRITGELTSKEEEAEKKRLASNHKGKLVMVDGVPAEVVRPEFGRVRVKFADGTTKQVDADSIKPIESSPLPEQSRRAAPEENIPQPEEPVKYEGPRKVSGITKEHSDALLKRLKLTPIGRALSKDANIVQTGEEALSHAALEGSDIPDSEKLAILRGEREGLYNPATGKFVVILDGIDLQQGEDREMAVRRVLIHERFHQKLSELYDDEAYPAFRKEMDKLTDKLYEEHKKAKDKGKLPLGVLESVVQDYPELTQDDARKERFRVLAEEYAIRLREGAEPEKLADKDPIFSRIWRSFRNAIAKFYGKSEPDKTSDELARSLIRRAADLMAKEGIKDSPEGEIRYSKSEPLKEDVSLKGKYGAWMDRSGNIYPVNKNQGHWETAAKLLGKDYDSLSEEEVFGLNTHMLSNGWVRITNGPKIIAESKWDLSPKQQKTLEAIGQDTASPIEIESSSGSSPLRFSKSGEARAIEPDLKKEQDRVRNMQRIFDLDDRPDETPEPIAQAMEGLDTKRSGGGNAPLGGWYGVAEQAKAVAGIPQEYVQRGEDIYADVKTHHQVAGTPTVDQKVIQHMAPQKRFLYGLLSRGKNLEGFDVEDDVLFNKNRKEFQRMVGNQSDSMVKRIFNRYREFQLDEWKKEHGDEQPPEKYFHDTADGLLPYWQIMMEDYVSARAGRKNSTPEDHKLAREMSFYANQAIIGKNVTGAGAARILRTLAERNKMNYVNQIRMQNLEAYKAMVKVNGGKPEGVAEAMARADAPFSDPEIKKDANAAEREVAKTPQVKGIEEEFIKGDEILADKSSQDDHEKKALETVKSKFTGNKEVLEGHKFRAGLIQKALEQMQENQKKGKGSGLKSSKSQSDLPDDLLNLINSTKSIEERISDLKDALKNAKAEIAAMEDGNKALEESRKVLKGEEVAKAIVKQMEKGTQEKSQTHPVRQRWWDQVRVPSDEAKFTEDMKALDVSDSTASALFDLAMEQSSAYAEKKAAKIAAGKNEYANTLNDIFQKITEMPVDQQSDAKARYEVIRQAMKDKGFNESKLDASARLLAGKDGPWEPIIANANHRAMVKAAQTLPGFKALSGPKVTQRDHDKWQKDMTKLYNASRAGLYGSDPLAKVMAASLGFKGFSHEDNKNLASWLSEAQSALPHRQAELYVNALDLLRQRGMPRSWIEQSTDAFRASLLSSINVLSMDSTMGAFSYAAKLMTDLGAAAVKPEGDLSRIDAMHLAIKNWYEPLKSIHRAGQFAIKRNAYTLHRPEQMSHYVSMEREMNDAHELITDKDSTPDQKAKGALQWIQASTQMVYRILSSGAQMWHDVMVENQMRNNAVSKLLMKSSEGRPGMSKGRIMNILNGMGERTVKDAEGKNIKETYNVFNEAAEEARARKYEPDQESRHIYDSYDQFLHTQISDWRNEGEANVARNVSQLNSKAMLGEHYGDPGFFFSRIGNMIVTGIAGMNKKEPFLGRLVSSFVRIPFNLLNTAAWMSPYGFARIGIHKYKTRMRPDGTRGESPYGHIALAHPELQMRQRIIEATAGTVALGLMLALRRKDDKGDGFFITGDGPQNKTARDAWQKQGYKPGSIGYKMGDKIVSVPWARGGIERFKVPAILVGAMDDMDLNHTELNAGKLESISEYASLALQSAGRQSNFLGLKNLPSNFGQAGTSAAAAAGSIASLSSGVVPWGSMLKSIGRMAVDAPDRSNIEAAVLAQLPVVSPFLAQPAINIFGDHLGDQPNTSLLKTADKAWWSGLPLYVNPGDKERSSPLYKFALDRGIMPSSPQRARIEEANGPLTEEKWRSYAETRGRMIKSAMLSRIGSLQSMPIKQAKSEVDRISNDATKVAKMRMGLK